MTDRTMVAFTGGQHPVFGASSFKNRYSASLDPRIRGNTGANLDLQADDTVRYESFILDEGQKKVESDPETRTLRRPSR